MKAADFKQWAGKIQERIESALDRSLPDPKSISVRLHAAMRYAVLGDGKRVRPLLCHAAGALTGAPAKRLEIVACAVELVHAYSLVHDDLPCMDDGQLRRGKPTCHRRYDEATALLVGDSLYSLAFELMGSHALTDAPRLQVEMTRLLAQATGSKGMAGGQAIDLESVGKPLNTPQLEAMHLLKTGALIRASLLLGAWCGRAPTKNEKLGLEHFAHSIGLAFQVVDDILDAQSSTEALGKVAGSDAERDKPTYVTVLGVNKARSKAAELHREALQALAKLGPGAARLRELADFIVLRQS
jgi:farnesyl diphosphate synthase